MKTETEKEMLTANMQKLQGRMARLLKVFCTFICALSLFVTFSSEAFAAEMQKNCTGNRQKIMKVLPTRAMSYSKEKKEYEYSEEELQALYRMTESEAGGESMRGKIAVSAVALNRFFGDNNFKHNGYKDITDVVYSDDQFTYSNHSYEWFQENRKDIVSAVSYAINGYDTTAEAFPGEGALYFYADWDNGEYGKTTIITSGRNTKIRIDRQVFYQ